MRRLRLPLVLAAVVFGTTACSASSSHPTTLAPKQALHLTVPAVAQPNAVRSWGNPTAGGPSCTSARCDLSPAPANVTNIAEIDAANDFSEAIVSGGRVVAWGNNKYGNLGNGTHTNSRGAPVFVTGLSDIVATATGNDFSIALRENGTLAAWGNNNDGQFGDGTKTSSDVPVGVPGLSGVVAIAAGGNHGLALLKDGTVVAWGNNAYGQLGSGKLPSTTSPVPVAGLKDVKAISSGNLFSDALLANGTVMDWGNNKYGQLGDGTYTNRDIPVQVTGLSGVRAISGGGDFRTNGHNMALLGNGTVVAWGDNASGQLGNGSTTNSATFVHVEGLTGITEIGAGGSNSMAFGGGNVWCWGDNTYGQVGNGDQKNVLLPVKVLQHALGISAGAEHSLAYVPA